MHCYPSSVAHDLTDTAAHHGREGPPISIEDALDTMCNQAETEEDEEYDI